MRFVVLRRYAPFIVLVAIQLVLIAVWPSRPGTRGSGPVAAATTGPATPGLAAPPAASGPEVAHCVGGRQFDPEIDFYAPPCVPAWSGKDNGGATSPGVTGSEIKVVMYLDKVNDALATIAGELLPPAARHTEFVKLAESFANSHFELYGRHITIKIIEGTCPSLPPDIACYRNEFRGIVVDESPFAVIYQGVCDVCIDELVQRKVLVVGNQPFTDSYARERAPYFWSFQQGGSTLARALAELWCTNFAGKPVRYSIGGASGQGEKPRRLGVVTANQPEYGKTLDELRKALGACGENVVADYAYALDLSTAAQQVQAGTDRLLAADVTSVTAFADPIGPAFLYGYAKSIGFLLEPVVSGSTLQDSDTFTQTLSPLACPGGPPCVFDTAVGLASTEYVPLEKNTATRVWRSAGREGRPGYETALLDWTAISLISTLIQSSGPKLTAANIDTGVRAYGERGDSGHLSRGFPEGSYYWGQASRAIYWDRSAVSPFNGKAGTFVPVGEPLVPGRYPAGLFDPVPRR